MYFIYSFIFLFIHYFLFFIFFVRSSIAGVLTLAFIELIVSVKVGGMPFELGKVNFGGGEQTFIVPKAPPVPSYDTTPFDSTLTGPRSL